MKCDVIVKHECLLRKRYQALYDIVRGLAAKPSLILSVAALLNRGAIFSFTL